MFTLLMLTLMAQWTWHDLASGVSAPKPKPAASSAKKPTGSYDPSGISPEKNGTPLPTIPVDPFTRQVLPASMTPKTPPQPDPMKPLPKPPLPSPQTPEVKP